MIKTAKVPAENLDDRNGLDGRRLENSISAVR